MEGEQSFNTYENMGSQPIFDQNQASFGTVDQQTPMDPNYLNYNYYENYQPPAMPDYTKMADNMPASYQQENLSYTNYVSKDQSASAPINGSLYKTKLCRHFQTKGFCNMGEKCNFAHGYEELKQSSGLSAPKFPATEYNSYAKPSFGAIQTQYKSKFTNPAESIYFKTALCRNYMDNGYCQFGDKWKFAHGPTELRTGPPKPESSYSSYAAGYQNYPAPYYPPPAATAAPGVGGTYDYSAAYPYNYSVPEASNEAYAAPQAAPQVAPQVGPTQNYGYNYTPESNYYSGFDYNTGSSATAPTVGASTTSAVSGSETMDQYYSENNTMNYNQYSTPQ